jgi:hypothetical protein
VATQLLPLYLLLDVARERGEPPNLSVVTGAAERLTIGPNRTLSLSAPGFKALPSPSGGPQYRIEARTMEEAWQRILNLKRKHPQIDVEATLAGAQMVETYPQGRVGHNLSIGGELAGQSMVKSCLAWAFANGVEWALCRNALDYLRGGTDLPFGYYHDSDLVDGRPAGFPLRCLAIDADPASGLILGYGEYFGFHRFVCLLGEGYRGPEVRGAYALDPRTGAEIHVKVRLPFKGRTSTISTPTSERRRKTSGAQPTRSSARRCRRGTTPNGRACCAVRLTRRSTRAEQAPEECWQRLN